MPGRLGEPGQDAGLEPCRWVVGRRELQELVPDRGELGDQLTAPAAGAQVA
jgi:hypothetical protein